jgi:hypothetical protein
MCNSVHVSEEDWQLVKQLNGHLPADKKELAMMLGDKHTQHQEETKEVHSNLTIQES